jgi:hypothetical protein
VETIATTSAGAPVGSGFGTTCVRISDSGQLVDLRYDLMVFADGRWVLFRATGEGTTGVASHLREGSAGLRAGSTPLSVRMTCSTSTSSSSTQIEGWVGSERIVRTTDQPRTLPGSSWAGGVVAPSTAGSFTASYTHFEEHSVRSR